MSGIVVVVLFLRLPVRFLTRNLMVARDVVVVVGTGVVVMEETMPQRPRVICKVRIFS